MKTKEVQNYINYIWWLRQEPHYFSYLILIMQSIGRAQSHQAKFIRVYEMYFRFLINSESMENLLRVQYVIWSLCNS